MGNTVLRIGDILEWKYFFLKAFLILLLLFFSSHRGPNMVLNNHALYMVPLHLWCHALPWLNMKECRWSTTSSRTWRWEKCWHLETEIAIPLYEAFVCVLRLIFIFRNISASLFVFLSFIVNIFYDLNNKTFYINLHIHTCNSNSRKNIGCYLY